MNKKYLTAPHKLPSRCPWTRHLNSSCCERAVQWQAILPRTKSKARPVWKNYECSIRCRDKERWQRRRYKGACDVVVFFRLVQSYHLCLTPQVCSYRTLRNLCWPEACLAWERERERMWPVDHHTALAQTDSKSRLQVTGPTHYQHLLVNTLLYSMVSVVWPLSPKELHNMWLTPITFPPLLA